MGNRLKDKVVIVTGAGRGIGRGDALALAAEGAKVVVNDLGGALDGRGVSTMAADEVVAEIKKGGGKAVANYDSVSTPEGGSNIIKTAIDKFGRIDALVNNAGILRDRMLWNMSDEEWDGVIKTHLYGHFYCTRAAVIEMRAAIKEERQKRGTIINVTSISGVRGNAGQPNYAAAKMGIVGFSNSLALALWRYGINVHTIMPGAGTRMIDSIPEKVRRESLIKRGVPEDVVNSLSLEELNARIGGDPAAIAPLLCWLISDEAKEVNGHVFGISEGRVSVLHWMEPVTEYRKEEGPFSTDELWQIMPELTRGLRNPAI